MDTTENDRWRLQSTTNKQGSGDFLSEFPGDWEPTDQDQAKFHAEHDPGSYLSMREREFHAEARELYEERLNFGVAREQARKDLPLSTYTEAFWKIDLKNLLHFLGLRMDSHAQLEIRQYATVIGEQIVKPLFPITWAAFCDYQFNAISLSSPDQDVIRKYFAGMSTEQAYEARMTLSMLADAAFTNKRERKEFSAKMLRLFE